MKPNHMLPNGWRIVALAELAEVNPPRQQAAFPADTPFHFVPMNAVSEDFGGVDVSTRRPLSEVAKGYTQFREKDVIFAKITPCMENGKIAVVPGLTSPWAYGSTEFHVLRPRDGIEGRWIAHFLSQATIRRDARKHMAGSAGQLRVPTLWLERVEIPVPTTAEQRRIVGKIEELFSDLDAGVAALRRIRATLKRYRASVLNAAVTGKLTQAWRDQNPPTESADALLARILDERRKNWEASQLGRFSTEAKTPPKRWRERYPAPSTPDLTGLPLLPHGWCWATIEQTCTHIVDCPHSTPVWTESGKVCIRTTEFRPGKLRLDDVRFVSPETYKERIARLTPEPGDIVYSREGGILGVACQIPPGVELCLGQRMMLLRSAVSGSFLMHVLNSPQVVVRVKQLTGGSASPHLNVGDVKAFAVPVPPADEQRQITELVDQRLSNNEAVELEIHHAIRRAGRLRQAILKRAFEGGLARQEPLETSLTALTERDDAQQASLLGVSAGT